MRSFDGGPEQTVNINGQYDVRLLERWQANRINETITKHKIETTGKYILRLT
ncbi:MAG: hypothetical protein LLF95_12130 [Bacteroidales bacterium]|nr:hypothetical protein [Bacteroidales bacterium]